MPTFDSKYHEKIGYENCISLISLNRLASVQEQRTCPDTAEESSPRSASEITSNTNKVGKWNTSTTKTE